MPTSAWFRLSALLLIVALAVSRSVDISAAAGDYPVAQAPLFIGDNQPPLMMMVMSRDEQLFNKAYSDYTDLDEDGLLDTTYQNAFEYAGYFDPNLCYGDSKTLFKAVAAATGPSVEGDPEFPKGNHVCGSNRWSGNFLNWLTMSRLDVVRHVLYGGQRSTDTTNTVLERAHIPNDLHAWVKVYSASDISKYTPFNSATSFCNASFSKTGVPTMRIASGTWSEWAATSLSQCLIGTTTDTPTSADNYTVRVQVCASSDAKLREKVCQPYDDGTTKHYKPVGLLQTYGETGRLRFGMISGSFAKPRSGGMLRRNIGKFAGNDTTTSGCSAGDEVDMGTGRFCNAMTGGAEGIVNTLSSFKLEQWGGSTWADCETWGYLNRQGFAAAGQGNLDNPGSAGGSAHKCDAWGNPLAEMYAEALRYVAGQTAGSTAYLSSTDLTGLPTAVKWNDPYRAMKDGGNSYCASCNILVMSSGLPSFDSDEMVGVPNLLGAAAATTALGTDEGITGSYMMGRLVANQTTLNVGNSVNTHEDICTATDIQGDLARVRGLCPDIPSMEGSYLMAGLSYQAWTTDLRPGLQGKPGSHVNNVQTYAVALAENLPKFDIPIGTGKITLSPLCQANKSGTAAIASANWRTCFLGSVGVGPKRSTKSPNHVYGRPLAANGSSGSFSLVWEDSLWGNDHDNDVVSMLTYCVGAACSDDTDPANSVGKDICYDANTAVCGSGSPTVGANEVLVRIENLSAYAGNAMLTGFAVSGSNNDGVKRIVLRPGGSDNSILTNQAARPSNWDKAQVMKFTVGSSSSKLLESPLWYAAKYGGFKDDNDNGKPDAGEWDKQKSGSPDNYFLARDPSKLKSELERIFSGAAGSSGTTAGGGAGARISTGSFTIDASFALPPDTNDWTGDVRALEVNSAGGEGAEIWSAAKNLPDAADRDDLYVVTAPTQRKPDGTTVPVVAASFTAGNLGATPNAQLAAMGMPTPSKPPVWFGTHSAAELVAYLKGDPVNEIRNAGDFRSRSSALGDIINSMTEIVTPLDDFGYGYWDGPAATGWKSDLGKSYKEYLADKADDPLPMVYVGANDGMLHGFEATEGASGGTEHFAFIPAASREHLYELADPGYKHRYYVDGGITTSDVSFDNKDDWHTVLVGTTGAGGRSIFALDVSDPTAFSAASVLWELSAGAATTQEQDLGYVMSKPVVVPVSNGSKGPRWVALFGNGANSENGAPVLYAVDIQTGAVLARLKPTGSAYAAKNGLMNIAPIAFKNSDGLVDTVYGGDLQGNVWKFDLSEVDPADWSVALKGEPLFTATTEDGIAQPITGGIEVSAGPGGGVSLFFGTGRYFADGDNKVEADPPVQSLYGIWDDMGDDPIGDRGELTQQTVTQGVTSNGYVTRNVSRNAVAYPLVKGWFVDLVVNDKPIGERFIGLPRLQNGKVFFTTYEPGDEDCSAGGGINWLYGLNLLTGGGGMSGVSTSPNGESVCTGDCGALALNDQETTAPPVKTASIFVPKMEEVACDPKTDATCLEKKLAAEQCTFVLRAAGAEPLYLPRPCGRQSWRQVR